MLERDFQKGLIKDLEEMFPGAIVTKVEPYIQGIPDLLILHKDKWAMLECKKSKEDAEKHYRPNQPYYVRKLNEMSYASFIYPENKEQVLHDLEDTFAGA